MIDEKKISILASGITMWIVLNWFLITLFWAFQFIMPTVSYDEAVAIAFNLMLIAHVWFFCFLLPFLSDFFTKEMVSTLAKACSVITAIAIIGLSSTSTEFGTVFASALATAIACGAVYEKLKKEK